jgi:hypothetical protein
MDTQSPSHKKFYSLEAGARLKARREQELQQLSDQDYEHDNGSPLGVALIGVLTLAIIVASMYGCSRIFG